MDAAQLQAFCTDRNLHELIDLSRSSDDLLAMIRPRETQRADLLAWAMDAGEGHGQSDVVFRNFMLEIHRSASQDSPGSRLREKTLGWHFVRHWTPARILAADFGSVVCYREYTMKDVDSKRTRPDFVIVDPANKLVIVVEIKAGAAFGKDQLKKYREAARKLILGRPAFSDYQKAFVAIDPNLDPTDLPRSFDKYWVAMDYAWLNHIERQAQHAVRRGDRGAASLQSLCRVLTGYEAPQDLRMNQLAAELCMQHPTIEDALRSARDSARDIENWSTQLLCGDETEHQMFRLYVQHQRALDRLIGLAPIQLLRTKLSEIHPALETSPELIDRGHVWFERALPLDPERQIPLQAGWWPLMLRVRHQNRRDADGEPRFRLSLHWWTAPFDGSSPVAVAAAILSKAFEKKGLDKERTYWLTLHEETCTGVKTATEATAALIQRIEALSDGTPQPISAARPATSASPPNPRSTRR